jgi:hypothetical protein
VCVGYQADCFRRDLLEFGKDSWLLDSHLTCLRLHFMKFSSIRVLMRNPS